MKIFEKKNCLLIGGLLCILMVIGSFFDFQISMQLFNIDSLFGMLLASYGQLPAMLCVSVAGMLLIKISKGQKKVVVILSYLFGILFNIFAIMGITMDPMLYIPHMSIVLSVMIAMIIVGVIDFIMWKLTQNADSQQVKKVIILFLGVMFLEIIIINIIKIPWGRPRMRMITAQNQVFQPWWVIGSSMKDQLMSLGITAEEFKSFPSGHSANAACAMMLGVLPIICQRLKGKENILSFIGIMLTLTVAFSRIIMGAHFLTDVTVGISVTFLIEVIFVHLLWKRKDIK
jgi:membrane-associated phospholipid phosphatase